MTSGDRILLIDDDRKLGEMVKDCLFQNGFEIVVAVNGEQGLSCHQSQSFDAVILDLMLPDLDGLEICRKIRLRDKFPS